MNRLKFTLIEINEIINLYAQGETQKEIAKKFNSYNTSIRRVLLKQGIKPRTNKEILGFVKENINTKEGFDYWIGMLATDGCVYKKRITLQLKDLDSIEQFKEFVGNKVVIKEMIKKEINSINYRIDFRNEDITLELSKLGITPAKSKTLELKTNINFEMLRGIFDGDGCITTCNNNKPRWNIVTASEKFANQIKTFLEDNGYTPTKTKTTQQLYCINLFKIAELEKLFVDLYKEGSYRMKRKYEKFGRLVRKPIRL